MLLSVLLSCLVFTVQPDGKTVPGQPGTDGSGGDSIKPVVPVATPTPPPAIPPVTPLFSAAAVPFPHPIITEVLYAVPGGPAGDTNRDGKREVAGDEFIELVNPHDKPIQLFGYSLTDSQEPGKGQLKFTFPALEVPPGGVVVVFNGFASTFAGPVGDSKGPPTGPDAAFGEALVFTMRNTNSKMALGNSGDHVMLTAPDGIRVQRVWWSDNPPAPPTPPTPTPEGAMPPPPAPGAPPAKAPPLLDDWAPVLQRTSVQRDGVLVSGRFVSHMDSEHSAFSPGVYVIARPPKPATDEPPTK